MSLLCKLLYLGAYFLGKLILIWVKYQIVYIYPLLGQVLYYQLLAASILIDAKALASYLSKLACLLPSPRHLSWASDSDSVSKISLHYTQEAKLLLEYPKGYS